MEAQPFSETREAKEKVSESVCGNKVVSKTKEGDTSSERKLKIFVTVESRDLERKMTDLFLRRYSEVERRK